VDVAVANSSYYLASVVMHIMRKVDMTETHRLEIIEVNFITLLFP